MDTQIQRRLSIVISARELKAIENQMLSEVEVSPRREIRAANRHMSATERLKTEEIVARSL
jgi:hypothetical protein